MEGGHFSAPIGLLKCLFLPPSALLRRVLLRLMLSWNLSIVPVASLVLRSAGSSGGRTLQTPYAVKPASSDPYKKISRKSRVTVPACVKVIKQLIRNASFSKEVVWDVASDLRKSTACFYRGQLFRFLHWCRGLNTAPLKATVWWIAMFFLYMLELRMLAPVMKGYRAALSHVFAQAGINLAANRVISRMCSRFEKNCLPREIKSLEWNPFLVLRSLTHPLYAPLKLSSDKHLEDLLSLHPHLDQKNLHVVWPLILSETLKGLEVLYLHFCTRFCG